MSINLAYTTIFVLAYTAIALWRTYGLKSLLHPGLYFCVLWMIGVVSFLTLTVIMNDFNIYNAKHVDELNGYVLFTAVLFLVFKRIGKRRVNKSSSVWTIHSFYPLFKYIALIALISAISMFIIRGASLDFAKTRDSTVEFETALFYGERSQTLLFTILGIFLSSNLILGIFAGFMISERLKNRLIRNVSFLILLIPILTQVMMMLTVGGRIDLINILRAYIFGLAISMANGVPKKVLKKIIISTVVFFVIFSAYSNFNYQQRLSRTSYSAILKESPILESFSSIIEYYTAVYNGYQLRRDDFVTRDLEYGEKTFAGILFFRIPFAGTLGLKKTSIGEYAGLEEYSMKKMFLELQSENAVKSSTVSSVYLLFYDDFGYEGTFVFLFFLVLITQLVFISWFKKPHKTFFSIYILFVFTMLWSNSIFDPVFAGGFIRSTFYSIATIQVIVFLRSKILGKAGVIFYSKDN